MMNSTNWPALNVWVFMVRLVEHCSTTIDCHWRYSNLIKICNTARHIILTVNLTVFVEFCLNVFVGAITATEKTTYDNFNCVYVELSLTASSIAV